jgi:hypothetical protein
MPAFWEQVRKLEGRTIFTLHQAKPFVVTAVEDDRVDSNRGPAREPSAPFLAIRSST